jgi:thiosulfate dehydrogenase [quinone] large subunit
MSLKEIPRQRINHIPAQHTTNGTPVSPAPVTRTTTVVGRAVAVVRIGLGLIFAWAFVDKMFGLGYATPHASAWINGGSPTKGFLGNLNHGPFKGMFTSWAGAAWADWLFMLGLAGIAFALLAGIGLRIAAVSGTLLLLMMWAAEWPFDRHTSTGQLTRSTNPVLDDHIIYILVLAALAAMSAGTVWGLGKWWANLDIVKKNRWLV